MLIDEDLFNESMEFYNELLNDEKEQEEFVTSILFVIIIKEYQYPNIIGTCIR